MFDSFISSSTIQSIKDAMVPVATAIGKGAEYGWTILIKQQYVVGTGYGIGAFAALIVMVTAAKFAVYAYKKQVVVNKENRYNDGANGVLCGLASFVTLIAFIAFFVCVYSSIAHFINPDFYSLQFLIDAVHPASAAN